jgi:protoporphyrinogen/coproporphyrinogen III oxidase
VSDYRQAIVIGAGITGLVAAYELQKRGLSVSILERSNIVGGVMRTEHRDGFLLEAGPNSFLESEEALQLISDLGLDSKFVAADPKAPRYIYLRGRLEPVPMSPLAFLTTSLLSFTGKLRFFAEPLIPARRSEEDESIASFVRRRIGKEAHDHLLSPFVSGVYAGNTEVLSMASSFPKMVELERKYGSLVIGMIRSAIESRREQTNNKKPTVKRVPGGKRLCTFMDGLSTLPNTISQKLDDALMTSCESIEIIINANSPRYRLLFRQQGETREFSTDKLIMATPAAEAGQLLSRHIPKLAEELEAIEYAPMAIVYISFDEQELSRPLSGFGFLVPRNQGIRILGSVWSSSLFPSRAPQGRTLLTNYIGGSHDPAAIDLSDDELTRIVGKELQSILGTSATPKAIGVARVRRAIPQYRLGHVARLARIREIEKAQAGLHLAGNYLQGVSVPDCISRALKLADQLTATRA